MSSSAENLDTLAFDYIVVGGGTSGLVIASRLTEDENTRVLVLEAGKNDTQDPRIFAPAAAPSVLWNEEFDWSFASIPQKQLNGRVIAHSMGKTLGGSSAVNLCMIIYPSRAAFDQWKALGNEGWGWDDLLPYFQKFHTYSSPSDKVKEQVKYRGDPSIQGKEGPIHVSFADEYSPFHEAWVPLFESQGYQLTGDPLSGSCAGAFISGASINPNTKERSHAGVAYYSPEVAARPNLRVVTEATVDKIELAAPEGGAGDVVATGVWVTTKTGERKLIRASKEVILAAGAFKTPQLLELSGIGGRSLLRAHGIETIVDNPNVGENMQDHGLIPFGWEVAEGQVSGDIVKQPEVAQAAMQAYMATRAGPMGQAPFVSSFLPLPLSTPERQQLLEAHPRHAYNAAGLAQHKKLEELLAAEGEPSAQYSFAPIQLLADGPLPADIFGMGRDGMYVSVITVMNYPFSRGSTHIYSADASAKPAIDTGYLTNDIDLEVAARHLLLIEKLMGSDPMAKLLKPGGRRLHSEHTGPITDLDDAKDAAKRLIISNYHSCGTAAMMPKEDGGVVSDKLVVYGTKNLRVVDASVFPLVPRGNIQATVYAVAEKAADIIKSDSK